MAANGFEEMGTMIEGGQDKEAPIQFMGVRIRKLLLYAANGFEDKEAPNSAVYIIYTAYTTTIHQFLTHWKLK